jgi:hypothetical protein
VCAVSSLVALHDTVWSSNREGSIIVWGLADKGFKQLKNIVPPVSVRACVHVYVRWSHLMHALDRVRL